MQKLNTKVTGSKWISLIQKMEKIDDYLSFRIIPETDTFIVESTGAGNNMAKYCKVNLSTIFAGIPSTIPTIRFGFYDNGYLKNGLKEFDGDESDVVLSYTEIHDDYHDDKRIQTADYHVCESFALKNEFLKLKLTTSDLNRGYREISDAKKDYYLNLDFDCVFELTPNEVKQLLRLSKIYNTNEYLSIKFNENGVFISDDGEFELNVSDQRFEPNEVKISKDLLKILDNDVYTVSINLEYAIIVFKATFEDGDETVIITSVFIG